MPPFDSVNPIVTEDGVIASDRSSSRDGWHVGMLIVGLVQDVERLHVDLGGPLHHRLEARLDVREFQIVAGNGLEAMGADIAAHFDRINDAAVVPASWKVPRTIELAVEAAGLSADEAMKTFNMGIGFALILDPAEAPKAAALLREVGETVYEIGEIVEGEGKVVYR